MRQIKFRAWDVYKKKFIPTDVWQIYPEPDSRATAVMTRDWEEYKEGECFYPENQVIQQFTGLTDKNGKEIYEGDIVKCDEFRTYKVYWNRDRWGLKEGNGFDYDNGDYYQGDDINNWKEFEVIGNVFENQDILNQLKGGK